MKKILLKYLKIIIIIYLNKKICKNKDILIFYLIFIFKHIYNFKYIEIMFWKIFVNILTFSRFILAILFSLIIVINSNPLIPCLIVYVLAITSDFFDGKIARGKNAASSKGAIFDVLADFSFIIITCSSLVFKNLLPFWIMIIIVLKLIEFWTTSKVANKRFKDEKIFSRDPFGHGVAILFYSLPIITVLLFSLLPITLFPDSILAICVSITILAIISSTIRIKSIIIDEKP